MGESGAQALAALKDAPSLHTLSLDLHGNSVGESGAQALAALKDAPSLHTLSLDLRGNSVGDSGAQALAALKDAASLHTCSVTIVRTSSVVGFSDVSNSPSPSPSPSGVVDGEGPVLAWPGLLALLAVPLGGLLAYFFLCKERPPRYTYALTLPLRTVRLPLPLSPSNAPPPAYPPPLPTPLPTPLPCGGFDNPKSAGNGQWPSLATHGGMPSVSCALCPLGCLSLPLRK